MNAPHSVWNGLDLTPLPHESSFSILCRFNWRNVLTARKVLAQCSQGVFQAKGKNFLSPSWIDFSMFHMKTGWTLPHPIETKLNAIFGDAITLWFSTKLRYCPLCLEDGYHSFWHQLSGLKKCPRHGCLIQSICQSCGKELPEYRATTRLLKHPYRCSICLAPFCGVKVSLASHIALRDQQGELFTAFEHLERWAESMRPAAILVRILMAQNSGWMQEWKYWCWPADLMRSIGHRECDLSDDRIASGYPDIVLISWRVKLRVNSTCAAGRERIQTSYLIRGAEPVYRATLRLLYKWIFTADTDDADRNIWSSLSRSFDGTTNLDGMRPELAAYFLFRQLMEEQLVCVSATDFYNVSIRSEACIRLCLHECQTPKIAWRALFLGMFAGIYHLIDRAKKTGVINLREMQINERSLVASFYRFGGLRRLEGGVVFPQIPGMPINPFMGLKR